MKEKMKKVMAWVVPEDIGEVYPICDVPLSFGYNPNQNDVVLDSFMADCRQASLEWKDEKLVLTGLSNNHQTLFNGEEIQKNQTCDLYHQDLLKLAGKVFSIHRRDEKSCAEVVFHAEDGSTISRERYFTGETVKFPPSPVKPGDAQYSYQFQKWELQDGWALTSEGKCAGPAQFRPVFRQEKNRYTLVFRAAEGFRFTSEKSAAREYAYNEPISFPERNQLKEENRLFLNWRLVNGTAPEGGLCRGDAEYEACYAQMKVTTPVYTITYQAEGGFTDIDTMSLTLQAEENQIITVPDETKLSSVEGLCFERWELVEGVPLQGGRCCGNAVYKAVYKPNSSGGTVKLQTFFIDENKKFYPLVPFAPFLFGGGAGCTALIASAPDLCAAVDGKSHQLTCEADGLVKVNGIVLQKGQSVQLCNGDQVEVCNNHYIFSTDKKSSKAKLTNPKGMEVVLKEEKTMLGHWHQKDFWMNSPYVGRNHASITRQNNVYVLKDLNSTNGTYLNGKKLQPESEVQLKPGDCINFADISCKFIVQ